MRYTLKKTIALLLCTAMWLTIMPVAAFADDEPIAVTEEAEVQAAPVPEPTAEPTPEPTQAPTPEPAQAPTTEPTAALIETPASDPAIPEEVSDPVISNEESEEESSPAEPTEVPADESAETPTPEPVYPGEESEKDSSVDLEKTEPEETTEAYDPPKESTADDSEDDTANEDTVQITVENVGVEEAPGESVSNDAAQDTISSGTCGDNLTWTLDSAGVLTISGTGTMTEYNSYSSYPWDKYSNTITKIIIEEGVTTIGSWAFGYHYDGYVTEVSIPGSVKTIGEYAFYECSVSQVTIPHGTTFIGGGAFSKCPSLNSVVISDTVLTISGGAFGSCPLLKEITFNGNLPPAMDSYAFHEVIATAFYPAGNTTYTSFTMQNYGGAINWIPVGGSTSIEEGICGDNLTWTLDNWGTLTINGYGAMQEEGSYTQYPWYSHCTQIKSVVVKDDITSIASAEFANDYSDLSTVTFPLSMRTIGEKAFHMSGVEDVYFFGTKEQWNQIEICNDNDEINQAVIHFPPIAQGVCGKDNAYVVWVLSADGILTITGDGEMANYSGQDSPWWNNRLFIKSLIIGEGVASIGKSAFYACLNMTSVSLPEGLKRIEDGAFGGCGLTSITIPSSVFYISSTAFQGSELQEINVVPGNTEYCSVDSVLFTADRKTLVCYPSLRGGPYTIPDGVTAIGESAFASCHGLTSVTIPDSVIIIGVEAFCGCVSLREINISASITRINQSAFSGSGASSIAIPYGVKRIGAFSFASSSNLSSITIPSSVTEIDTGAFDKCDKLRDVYYIGTEEQWLKISISHDAIYSNSALTNATKHFSYIAAGLCGENLTWTLDQNGVLTIIGTGTMENYTTESIPWSNHTDKVKAVIIGEGVTTIGSYTFSGCNQLEDVTINGSIEAIGNNAFRKVTATVHYPGGNLAYTNDLKINYGGDLTWIPFCYDHSETHTPGEPKQENEIVATCTLDGSYDEVVYCSVCNEELSRKTITTEKLGHDSGESVRENEVAVTCTANGSYDEVVYCSVCGEELSRETKTIPASGHTHTDPVREKEVPATYESEGSYDEVVYCSVCGEELSRETKTIPKLAQDITISDTALTITVGKNAQLKVYDGSGEQVSPNWSAENIWAVRSDENVVTVNSRGMVFALAVGEAKVTAEYQGQTVSMTVTVVFADNADTSKYYYEPIIWAAKNGITTGTSATGFTPNAACTRGQIVTFLWRAMGEPQPLSTKNPFKDVKDSDYYYLPVLWAYYEGVTTGTSDTTFAPNDPCTRKQIVTFLWRAQGSPKPASSANPFKDVKATDYFYDAVLWAVGNKITTGTSDTTFAPNAACSRGQCVTFLWRAKGCPES